MGIFFSDKIESGDYEPEKYDYLGVNHYLPFTTKSEERHPGLADKLDGKSLESDIRALEGDGWELLRKKSSIVSGTHYLFRRPKKQ